MPAARAFVVVNKASDWLSAYPYLQGAWFRSLWLIPWILRLYSVI